jgi:membrane protein
LWGAFTAVKQLIVALSAAYQHTETRSYVKLRAMAAAFTVGGLVLAILVVLLLTVVPGWVQDHVGVVAGTVVLVLRWPLLAAVMIGALAVLYRYAPDRGGARWTVLSWGAGLATAIWLGGSGLFSLYATHFASYNKTYGTLGAVVVFMLWLLITAVSCLLGAEINSEIERPERTSSVEGG